ncbi:hypothetical protein [Streptomyces parvulus]|uniref:hypothetical protein n=1 Tax=Streptomyces parvulus TaxID=146923 RepID=UPI003407C33E
MSTTAEPGGLRIVGWCSWHEDAADDVRVVEIAEQGSGRGALHYACGDCREEHGLVPLAEQDPRPAEAPVDPVLGGARLIPMPGMHSCMSDDQRYGRACPWCNTPVTAESGVDLGERRLEREHLVLHPVACRDCIGEQARQAVTHHARTCLTCHRRQDCEARRLLRRLALETRR